MLPGTSNSVIIVNVFTRHSTTRPRKRSITSTSTGSPQHEIAINQLSGKDKAAHYELGGDVSPRHRPGIGSLQPSPNSLTPSDRAPPRSTLTTFPQRNN